MSPAMREIDEAIIIRLRDALNEHQDDCLLCAVKDTRINEVLALLEAAKAEPAKAEPVIDGAMLKPCPFCGSPAELRRHGIHRDRWIVECSRIECRYTYETALDALKYWNAPRHNDKEIDRLTAENQALRLQHDPDCNKQLEKISPTWLQNCTCGLEKLVAENKAHAERIEKLETFLTDFKDTACREDIALIEQALKGGE